MAKQISFGSMFVGNTASPAPESVDERVDVPFQILVIAHLSGARGEKDLADNRPAVIDRDNFDDVLSRMRPSLSLDGIDPAGRAIELEFAELDDFHPDRLYGKLSLFEELRDLRDHLQSPATFKAAAEQLLELSGQAESARGEPGAGARQAQSSPAAQPSISGEDLLSQMIGESPDDSRRLAPSREASEFRRILAQVAAPHQIAADDPHKQQYVELVDALAADRMRAILHHPAFQSLEAAWRGVHLLTRRLPTDENLKIFVIDCSKAALAADLEAAANLRSTALYRLLADRPAGSPRWGIVVGNYEFAATQADIEMLGRIAQIAERAGTPFLAAASTTIFGCPSIAKTPDPDDWQGAEPEAAAMWQQLRQFPQATWLGLAAPRLLLRLPYGRDGSPAEQFDFEELAAGRHDDYLWGNSAIACACLLGQTFSETGWPLEGRLYRDLDDLAAHVFDEDGESRVKPCAEAVLRDAAVERILDAGIMPLQSFADRGTVRLVRLQSVADPPAVLAGLE